MSNVSRAPCSQVEIDLRFRHEDMVRVQQITSAIEEDISASCPKLIVDGHRHLELFGRIAITTMSTLLLAKIHHFVSFIVAHLQALDHYNCLNWLKPSLLDSILA